MTGVFAVRVLKAGKFLYAAFLLLFLLSFACAAFAAETSAKKFSLGNLIDNIKSIAGDGESEGNDNGELSESQAPAAPQPEPAPQPMPQAPTQPMPHQNLQYLIQGLWATNYNGAVVMTQLQGNVFHDWVNGQMTSYGSFQVQGNVMYLIDYQGQQFYNIIQLDPTGQFLTMQYQNGLALTFQRMQ